MERIVAVAFGFDLLKRLGSGYFGEVWHARDLALDIECAVKLIPPDKITNKKNFFHEAQVLQAAKHQNVVQIREAGQMDDGRIYIAMEYLPKGSLEDEAGGAYVHLTRAKRLMIDVLRGLEHAHRRDILHRDIKPANILIGNATEGKLSDFGLAVPRGANLKKLGVEDYAYVLHQPPEVHQGNEYGVVADIYACGITLYRLVNGDEYLPAIPITKVPDAAARGKYPDRSRYRDFVPRPLRVLINRAMRVRPEKRYRTAGGMRRALERISIEMNWDEQKVRNGVRWSCGHDRRCYEVTKMQASDGKWSVQVRKGRSKRTLRRMRKHCETGLTETKADRAVRRILQDFVLGRMT